MVGRPEVGHAGPAAHASAPAPSDFYPGATDIQPEWTQEAAKDPHCLVRDPDPKRQTGAIRLIGYSPAAGFVLTVIINPVDQAGITAWKTRCADLRDYLGERGRS